MGSSVQPPYTLRGPDDVVLVCSNDSVQNIIPPKTNMEPENHIFGSLEVPSVSFSGV